MNIMAKMFCVMCMMLSVACEGGGGKESDETTPAKNYGTPYTKDIGGYSIHNFISNSDKIEADTVADDVNHYMALAETYIKGLVNDFEQSLNGRPAAKEYFSEFTNRLKNTNTYNVNGFDGERNLDTVLNSYYPSQAIFADIIKNLSTPSKRGAFYYSFRVLDNESYYEGLGSMRKASGYLADKYHAEKNLLVNSWFDNSVCYPYTNLQNNYDQNNFLPVAKLTDGLLQEAASNMQNKAATQDVKTADLKKVFNITLTASSLGAMHDLTTTSLNHKGCMRVLDLKEAMEKAAEEVYEAEQNSGLVR